ncbi:MAG TPA: aldo/keto reductase [candidate division Zixibacteria bacterium]|nr:aldo/keto reductase [candidate division Zixibacteria bacterium]
MSLSGCATRAGTENYRRRFAGAIPDGHFRLSQDLWLSSIGIGTYLGNPDDATDRKYRAALIAAVELGCNVIDTAANYRCQRSERSVGEALKELSARGYRREEIVIATKGGFIPYDGAPPEDPRLYFEEAFVKTGIASLADVVGSCHCMTPKYLRHQLECSLRNLALDCIDVYYLHNPEIQLGRVSPDEFRARLTRAFETLEEAAAAGKIRHYGTATWNGYRNPPSAKDYLSLSEVVELAAKAGGREHRFKFIQLPVNLGMTEALSLANQNVGGAAMTLLEAAERLGITVMASASILQGQLARNLPGLIAETFEGLESDAQRSLQFVRSTPGVTTALVGMKQVAHVEENLRTARVAPASWEQYSKLFQAAS